MSPYDAVVMLTWSNWFTELRSNRYHYATRFASCYPVLFVQPDRDEPGYLIETSEIKNLMVLHVPMWSGRVQTQALNDALRYLGIQKPLYWVYNVNFVHYLVTQTEKTVVFHATEDYLSNDSPIKFKKRASLRALLFMCLEMTDILVSVSEGVAQSYLKHTDFSGDSLVVSNGCDYDFYQVQVVARAQNKQNIAFYQGNIFNKLDYDLLIALVQALPAWQFHFCGPVLFHEPKWQQLKAFENVCYLGILTPEQLRDAAHQATVGIIPFQQDDWLVKRSLPLKAFEYLACDLPVVSTPIDALKPYAAVFSFAETLDAFKAALERSSALRENQEALKQRRQVAKSEGYDQKFDVVHQTILKQNFKPNQTHVLSRQLKQNLKRDLVVVFKNKLKTRVKNKLKLLL